MLSFVCVFVFNKCQELPYLFAQCIYFTSGALQRPNAAQLTFQECNKLKKINQHATMMSVFV